jgi:methylated-DNA-protein-cysteine methyltransferase related protein
LGKQLRQKAKGGLEAFALDFCSSSLLNLCMPDFRNDVLTLVKAVPKGKVVTYGQVAMLIGSPQKPRQVGMVLRGLKELDGDVPWQRVVNSQGGISTYKVGTGELQKVLLESEGIKLRPDQSVDLKKYQWWPERI